MLFIDPLSNEANLPCILSNFDKISCKASEDGEDEVELPEAVEVAAALEESTPNKESSSSFEMEPSLILRSTFFAFNFFT